MPYVPCPKITPRLTSRLSPFSVLPAKDSVSKNFPCYETFEAALVTISEIKDRLAALQVTLDLAATEEQIADIKIKVAQISEGIALLVFKADYDYDGVMNGLDQCPDTPITQISSVDANGCSPEQLAG